ncbi:hypothetical protein BV25DRAFT_1813030, partial [Artomyces pyxidatus]
HYALWAGGIQHKDPSLDNLMVRVVSGRPGKEDVLYGVMNDWDLATLSKRPSPHAFDITGTAPFMALELLNEPGGTIVRRYRHDLESMIWILSWVFIL